MGTTTDENRCGVRDVCVLPAPPDGGRFPPPPFSGGADSGVSSPPASCCSTGASARLPTSTGSPQKDIGPDFAPGSVDSAGLQRQHVIGTVRICPDFRYQAVDPFSDRFEDGTQIPALTLRKELCGQIVVQRPFGFADEPMRFTPRLRVYQNDCLERLPVGELAVESRDVIAIDDPHPVAAQVNPHHAARSGVAKVDRNRAKPGRESMPAASLERLPGTEGSLHPTGRTESFGVCVPCVAQGS